jgi:alkylhydroperoxidase/carboxymuconolactone decarboxylase family protein YurZ
VLLEVTSHSGVLIVAHYAGWPRSTTAMTAAGSAKAAFAQGRAKS